jgi:hypothetical protein
MSFALPGPDSPWLKTWERAKDSNPITLGEMDLRYKYFGVNIELIVGDVEIVSKTGFVTLVDLALSLTQVVQQLASGQDAAFGFTESEEVIHLRQRGDTVEVDSSSSSKHGSANREEVGQEIVRFVRAAHARLVTEIPQLSENPIIQRISLE